MRWKRVTGATSRHSPLSIYLDSKKLQNIWKRILVLPRLENNIHLHHLEQSPQRTYLFVIMLLQCPVHFSCAIKVYNTVSVDTIVVRTCLGWKRGRRCGERCQKDIGIAHVGLLYSQLRKVAKDGPYVGSGLRC